MHRAPGPELRAAAVRRDRLGARVTVLGNALALAATAGTGVITGVLAHSAQAADLQKAQAKAQAEAAARAAAGPQVRLVPKPVKVVTVKVRDEHGAQGRLVGSAHDDRAPEHEHADDRDPDHDDPHHDAGAHVEQQPAGHDQLGLVIAAPTAGPAQVRLRALGTEVHVLVTEPALLAEAEARTRGWLDDVDRACSRFRDDSELLALRGSTGVGPVLGGALRAALEVAELTDGLVVPTLGGALRAAGYDRTFDALPADGPAAVALPLPPEAWRDVRLDGDVATVPAGVQLDLGATAKAWAADVLADLLAGLGTGVLVNLGGDVAVAGPPPAGGWDVGVTDRPGAPLVQVVTLEQGGLATSSTTARRWRRGGVVLHHVLDPVTGRPAPETWRCVTVAAPSCLEANAATTAAVVLGPDAPQWLTAVGHPALLVAADGSTTRLNGWPEDAP